MWDIWLIKREVKLAVLRPISYISNKRECESYSSAYPGSSHHNEHHESGYYSLNHTRRGGYFMGKIDVFKFTDAKLYLRRCQESKMPPWPMTYSLLAEHVGVNKGFIWGVMYGKKLVSRKIADRLPPVLHLTKSESIYLRVLLYLSGIDIDEKLKISILDKFRPAHYRKR